MTDLHRDYMMQAIALGVSGLGRTAPNPSVGCVIVKNDRIMGAARSADGGRPHAETQALEQAGSAAQEADVYVSLEPCAHEGKTPACAKKLIDAKVARVYVACTDPDPRTAGKGIKILRDAGIQVIEGLCEQEARVTHEGFFKRLAEKRPFISVKIATSLDGRIAAADGTSQWITGEAARLHGHTLRGQYDAIITGSGTFLKDHPQLTVRRPDYDGPQPLRIVLDRRGRLSRQEGWIIINDYQDISEVIDKLYTMELTRVLIEAGQGVSSAFVKNGYVDRLYWFRAPIMLGDKGLSALDDLNIATLNDKLAFTRQEVLPLDQDLLEIYAAGV